MTDAQQTLPHHAALSLPVAPLCLIHHQDNPDPDTKTAFIWNDTFSQLRSAPRCSVALLAEGAKQEPLV